VFNRSICGTIGAMAKTTLLKFLTESGAGSRRAMADAIRESRVRVNNIIAENFRQEINPARDTVTLDGQRVMPPKARKVYLVLNKPAGIVTTTSDDRGRETVLDLLPEKYREMRLFPVGRLDKDSTGLLILTNDGDLTQRLTHPRYEHEKEYLAAIEGSLDPKDKEKLETGIELADGPTSQARIRPVRNAHPFNYSITIHEGRNRQVRRMFEFLGYRVLALRRMRVGNLRLGDLREGDIRPLSESEVKYLLAPPSPKRESTRCPQRKPRV